MLFIDTHLTSRRTSWRLSNRWLFADYVLSRRNFLIVTSWEFCRRSIQFSSSAPLVARSAASIGPAPPCKSCNSSVSRLRLGCEANRK